MIIFKRFPMSLFCWSGTDVEWFGGENLKRWEIPCVKELQKAGMQMCDVLIRDLLLTHVGWLFSKCLIKAYYILCFGIRFGWAFQIQPSRNILASNLHPVRAALLPQASLLSENSSIESCHFTNKTNEVPFLLFVIFI